MTSEVIEGDFFNGKVFIEKNWEKNKKFFFLLMSPFNNLDMIELWNQYLQLFFFIRSH